MFDLHKTWKYIILLTDKPNFFVTGAIKKFIQNNESIQKKKLKSLLKVNFKVDKVIFFLANVIDSN